MKKYKNDIVFVVVLFIIVIIFMSGTKVFYGEQGKYVKVCVDGKEETVLNINEDIEYSVRHGDSLNIIKIEDGKVSVVDANCRDELCVKQGSIKNNGESIICLPHKVVVTVVSDDEKQVDAVSE